jgi:hypothetical protein
LTRCQYSVAGQQHGRTDQQFEPFSSVCLTTPQAAAAEKHGDGAFDTGTKRWDTLNSGTILDSFAL